MLGHRLWLQLRKEHDVRVTLRKPLSFYGGSAMFDPSRTLSNIDVANSDSLETAFRLVRPEAVINCVGIIKQLREATDPLVSLNINSMLPHRIARLCAIAGSRLIHISTDCVFSGRKGGYREDDISDAEDLYGRTKFLGEVHESHCTTLRTSIIGHELETKNGLIEWFLSQTEKVVKGYRKAIFTGFTTLEMARIIRNVLTSQTDLPGLWHVSSEPISKYDLLEITRRMYGWQGTLIPDESYVCDRSMDSTRFRNNTGYCPPSWEAMLQELADSNKGA